jgi:hypothetical protein
VKRALVIGGIALVALAGLYAAAGYWLAPRLVRDALVERAREAGLDVRVERVRTDPFALSVELNDLRVSTLKGERLLSVQRAAADLSARSALARAWIVERVVLEHPVLMALPAASAGGGGGATPRIEVREASISDGVVQLAGQPRLSAIALSVHQLSRYELEARIDAGGRVQSEGTLQIAPFAAHGKLGVQGAALGIAWHFLPRSMGEAPKGAIDGSLAYRFADGRLAVSELDARATLASGGTLRAGGEMKLAPFSATLNLEGEKLPLALIAPLVESHAAVQIASGTVSGKGRLTLGGKAPRYEGSLALGDTKIVDANGRLLLGWQALESDRLALAFSPFALHLEEAAARAPHARIVIDKQGRINFAQVLAARSAEGSGERPDVQVQRLRIAQGRVDFSDRSLPTPFGTTVRDLAGTLTGLGSAQGQAARVRLDGRVGQYGEARVRGTVDLDAPSERTNLNARLRNLALPDFTPYAAKFAGYRIEGGRLDAELRYRVDGGRLVGTNQLVFQNLKLGEKVESASALDLPIELAVALLTDAEGRINLAIPVSGNLNDPHFDAAGLVAKALGNTLRKIVSAPFRLLASLVRGGDDAAPDAVQFAAGSAALSPADEEAVVTLAKALAERPQVAVAIHAGYDADKDARALRRQALLAQLAARAGKAPAAAGASTPPQASDPKIVAAAERLYRDRGASASDLARLEPGRPGYARRQIDALAP